MSIVGRPAGRSPTRPRGRRGSAEAAPLLDRAIAEGIITVEQAAAIRALQPEEGGAPRPEGIGGPERERTPLVRRGRVPLYAEVLAYLGSVLVAVGAVSLVARFWDDLGAFARLAALGGAALVLWGVGASVDEDADPALWRLRAVTWLLSTGALAGFAAVLAIDGFGWEGEPVAVTAGTAVAVASAGLWRLQDRPAQQLSTVAGAAVAIGAGAALADGPAAVGAGLWVLGALWVLGGLRGILVPGYVALPVGAGLTLLGAGVTGGSWQGIGPLVGLGTAAVLLWLGVAGGRFPLIGAGVLGLLIYVPSTGTYYFADTLGAPLTLLASGLVLLVGALDAFRRRTS